MEAPRRSTSRELKIFHAWLGGDGEELVASTGPRFDLERLGCRVTSDHRDADALFVAGVATPQMSNFLKKVYSEMPKPCVVVAVGSGACTGGMYALPGSRVVGLSEYIPVNYFIPGNPPRPESIIHAILQIQKDRNPGGVEE